MRKVCTENPRLRWLLDKLSPINALKGSIVTLIEASININSPAPIHRGGSNATTKAALGMRNKVNVVSSAPIRI
ncbi:hypothetical protein D3C73_967730 [compost metagenome]